MTTIVVSPYRTVKFPEGGGHFWVYLQYVHGLAQTGCDVYWMERFDRADAGPNGSGPAILLERLKRYGLDGKVILCTDAEGGSGYDYIGATPSEVQAVMGRADLLLNFQYSIEPELLAGFRRTALVDIDPGLSQVWMSTGQVPVARHDLYFTIGETVGTPAAGFTDAGLDWVHIRPPVCLDLWPYTYDPHREAFTTVTDWWTGWVPETVDGREVLYDNTKRAAFLAYAELARMTSQPLELAIHLSAYDEADRRLLERHGWRVRHSSEVSSTPETYRSYIQGSRGEFSCVKPSYVKTRSAWISDRSLCYMASGKPVVVQDTGPSSFLPTGEGIVRFSSLEEAAEALATVNADYPKHCLAAREIAATYFDARKTAERILNVALA
jgi:hypothetical protein